MTSLSGLRLALSAALALALVAPACASQGEPAPGPDAAELDESVSALAGGGACSCGEYFCPDDGSDVPYATPGCGGITKPQASSVCNSRCVAQCVDSGWSEC